MELKTASFTALTSPRSRSSTFHSVRASVSHLAAKLSCVKEARQATAAAATSYFLSLLFFFSPRLHINNGEAEALLPPIGSQTRSQLWCVCLSEDDDDDDDKGEEVKVNTLNSGSGKIN